MTLKQRFLGFRRFFLGLKRSEEKAIKYHEVIEQETTLLQKRRKKLGLEKSEALDDNKFGIALSGGGIRSATINLGFLETLNEFNILKRADYISTVSGGGYTGAYIQATLKEEQGDYSKLFEAAHISHLRNNGEYMTPGKGLTKLFNQLILIVGFSISLLMSWLSPFIIGMMVYLGFLFVNHFGLDRAGYEEVTDFLFLIIIPSALFLLFLHFILNVLWNYHLHVSNFFNRIQVGVLIIIGLIFGGVFIKHLQWSWAWETFGVVSYYLMVMFALFVLGYFANPNALSFHRFYRNQLANAFLSNVKDPNTLLQNLIEKKEKPEDNFIYAPYPLINTCLNLLATTSTKKEKFSEAKKDFLEDGRMEMNIQFAGAKASDYFLLSPLFCGSKLAGYVPTDDTYNYRDLTLPAAATISAAAVNPGMGSYSNKILGILTTILNLRLGYWILNPKKNKFYDSLVWWPRYFVYELLGKIGMNNEMLNISDGGHIENLGIYELLRRRCKLILAVDAEADPKFTFEAVQNLAIRARNELGLEIRFPKNYLEEDIRPKSSAGYSRRRFAVGDVCYLWEEILLRDDEQKIILGKNRKPIEILINYKKYEANPDRDEVLAEILTSVQNQISQKVTNDDLRNEALHNIEKIISKRLDTDFKMGTLVYVKSSVTPPQGKPAINRETDPLKFYTYKYKIYNPDFPHESTADQFFDPVQWTAYYELGRYICGDVLGIENLDNYLRIMKQEMKTGERPSFDINDLIQRRFGRRVKIFEEFKQQWEQERARKEAILKEKLAKDFPIKKSIEPVTMRQLEERMTMDEPVGAALPEDAPIIEPADAPPSATEGDNKIVVGEDVDYKM
ncbi:MAG: hypothetical protein AAF573_00985 [Bacteroidota bacterium]